MNEQTITINSTMTAGEGYTFFFDIDNCLYPKSYKIHEMMAKKIDEYFVKRLDLDPSVATELHQKYYKDYGLALEGLVRHHQIDPLEYNSKVDDTLPLDKVLKPEPKLRELLLSIDRNKVEKLWLFTNAYITHAKRVVELLGIDDLFDGITYCDYSKPVLICKPKKEMYELAMQESGTKSKDNCIFIDDSFINIKKATEFGWKTTIQYIDPSDTRPSSVAGKLETRSLFDLPRLLPDLFKHKEYDSVSLDNRHHHHHHHNSSLEKN